MPQNPNAASLLVMLDDAEAVAPEQFGRCGVFFDRNDPAMRDAARARWRRCLAAGHTPVYWEFSSQGWHKAG
jgi:DNA polymerase-3 subunit chi